MGESPRDWLNRRWFTHVLPVVLGGIMVAGGLALAPPGHATVVRTRDAAPPADYAPPLSTTTTSLAAGAVPAPSTRPTGGPAPAVQVAAIGYDAARWQPSHPQADYMGAAIAGRAGAFFAPGLPTLLHSGTPGIDVSAWQGHVDWASVAATGVRFAYIKATEATTYTDPQFGPNYAGAAAAGLIRGAYHFAVPNVSSGAAQANFFVDHGGAWVADGRTLPPALDIEYNPYGSDPCYGLTQAQMTSWIADFATTVFNRTHRWPVIYTTTGWWATCTGNSPQAGAHSGLWLASWTSSGQVRNRPDGWSSYTFWQYADHGAVPGDQDYFNGTDAQLHLFAAKPDSNRPPAGPVPGPVAPPLASLPVAPGRPTPPSGPIPAPPTGPSTPPVPSPSLRIPSSSSPLIPPTGGATSTSVLPAA